MEVTVLLSVLAAQGEVVSEVGRPVLAFILLTQKLICAKFFMLFVPLFTVVWGKSGVESETAGTGFRDTD